jgi:hypothetical protein
VTGSSRAFWIGAAGVGAVVLAAAALPAAWIVLDVSVGDEPIRGVETVRFLRTGSARGIAVVASGLVLLALGAIGSSRGVPRAFVPLVALAAVVAAVQGIQTLAYVTGEGSGRICTAYEVSHAVNCGGPVLGPELRGLYLEKAPVPKGDEANAAELAYRARPRIGLWLLLAATVPFSIAALYRTARLRIERRWLALVLVATMSVVLLAGTLLYLAFANYGD